MRNRAGIILWCESKKRVLLIKRIKNNDVYYVVAGGGVNEGESFEAAAKRELYEETGAIDFAIKPVCIYSVVREEEGTETFGKLYFAEVTEFEGKLHSEIEKIILTDELVDNWTYPLIQPKLLEEARRREAI